MIFPSQYDETPLTWRAITRQLVSSVVRYAVVAVLSAIVFILGAAAWSYPTGAAIFVAGAISGVAILLIARRAHLSDRVAHLLPHHA
jgi:hypothetical protein